MTQAEKVQQFQALHLRPGPFLIPNPDAGSARILTGLGFDALATSSAASAAALGRRDGKLGREEALAHGRVIVLATNLPVAADLENGFAHTPEGVAETVRLAAAAVKRISFAASFYRAAMTGLINAALEAKDSGTFNYPEENHSRPRALQVFASMSIREANTA